MKQPKKVLRVETQDASNDETSAPRGYSYAADVPRRFGTSVCLAVLNQIAQELELKKFYSRKELMDAVASRMGVDKQKIYRPFTKALRECRYLAQSQENDSAYERI